MEKCVRPSTAAYVYLIFSYIVVDGAMTEVLRPALYDAYHHIDLAEPSQSADPDQLFDIVGPVCESADFLGKVRNRINSGCK